MVTCRALRPALEQQVPKILAVAPEVREAVRAELHDLLETRRAKKCG